MRKIKYRNFSSKNVRRNGDRGREEGRKEYGGEKGIKMKVSREVGGMAAKELKSDNKVWELLV